MGTAPPGASSSVLARDETRVFVASEVTGSVYALDRETLDPTWSATLPSPGSIVLSPDGRTAYVNNTLSGTVSVINTADYQVVDEIKVTEIPLPPLLLEGKRLFHSSDDPRLGRVDHSGGSGDFRLFDPVRALGGAAFHAYGRPDPAGEYLR